MRAVLFDMDGTLIDTEPIHLHFWCEVMRSHGYVFEDSLLLSCIGLNYCSMEQLFKKTFGESFEINPLKEEVNMVVRQFKHEKGVPVKPGYQQLVTFLKTNNIKMVIATSSTHDDAVDTLKVAGIYDDFDGIIGGDEVKNGKPDKEPFWRAAQLVGVPVEECIAVEDSQNGIKSAHNAGVKCIYIKDMKDIPPEVESLVFARCNDLSEVINYIK